MEKTLFLIDDHAMLRRGIIGWFNDNSNWKCIGDAGTKDDALSLLEKLNEDEKLPSVIITDINMNGQESGVEIMKEVKEKYPSVKLIAYSMYTSPGIIQKSILSGCEGYVSKTNDETGLLTCIESVFSGQQYIEPGLVVSLVSYNNAVSALTKREQQVFELLLKRKSNTEISEELNLKRHAVENYISFIYEKIGCMDRNDLLRKFGKD